MSGLTWLTLALGACIIEERTYDKQLDDCWTYCDLLDENCTGSNKVYEHREACMGTCMLMENGGEIGDTTTNTLACRIDRLQTRIEGGQCQQVGPGSAGECGSNCKALCKLRSQVCANVSSATLQSDVTDVARCEDECLALWDRQAMDAGDTDLSGDTVQCRLVYISQAAVSPEEAAKHCEHSQIRPTPGENPDSAPCSDAPGTDLNLECSKYCQLVTTACTGANAVYQDEAQCLDTCKKTMSIGGPGNQTEDTIRCRRYHAYFSLVDPAAHCLHASATGDGHCGGENCTGYCRVLQKGCGERFTTEFGAAGSTSDGGLTACVEQCSGTFVDDGLKKDAFAVTPSRYPRYSVEPPPSGNTLLCRTYYAVQSLSAPLNCAAAFGEGACR